MVFGTRTRNGGNARRVWPRVLPEIWAGVAQEVEAGIRLRERLRELLPEELICAGVFLISDLKRL